jgi:hypothetical protein
MVGGASIMLRGHCGFREQMLEVDQPLVLLCPNRPANLQGLLDECRRRRAAL